MNILFVANYPKTTGYAWHTIGEVFRRVSGHLEQNGHRVSISYAPDEDPRQNDPDTLLVDYLAVPRSMGVLRAFIKLLRVRRIEALYLTDQPTWSPLYALYRAVGVKRIIVHDRTSGERQAGGVALFIKRGMHRLPGMAADRVIGVSDFVTRRLVQVNGAPPARVFRVYNGIDLSRFDHLDRTYLRRQIGLPDGVPILFFSGRAQTYKGVEDLLLAVDWLQRDGRDIAVVVCGAGPDLQQFRDLAAQRNLKRAFFLGRRDDVPALLAGATVAAVPSRWAEAFGLTVVEAMAAAVPVVATRTGGIPELIVEGSTGLLVPPGDPGALAAACARLLDHSELASRMACAGRHEAVAHFGVDRTARELADLLEPLLK